MKKLSLLTAVILICLQSFGQLKFAAGIKGGLNFSNLNLSTLSTSGTTGYHAGVFAQFRFSKVAIQPEIILSQQGSVVDFKELESSYINIPLIVKIYLAAGVNLQFGPQFGFLNKAELEDRGDVKDLLKTADISAGLGVGWDAPFGLTCEARYNLGLTDNNDDLYNEPVKNQVFQLSVGFKIIRLGKK